jgi:hypothetical protein
LAEEEEEDDKEVNPLQNNEVISPTRRSKFYAANRR